MVRIFESVNEILNTDRHILCGYMYDIIKLPENGMNSVESEIQQVKADSEKAIKEIKHYTKRKHAKRHNTKRNHAKRYNAKRHHALRHHANKVSH